MINRSRILTKLITGWKSLSRKLRFISRSFSIKVYGGIKTILEQSSEEKVYKTICVNIISMWSFHLLHFWLHFYKTSESGKPNTNFLQAVAVLIMVMRSLCWWTIWLSRQKRSKPSVWLPWNFKAFRKSLDEQYRVE